MKRKHFDWVKLREGGYHLLGSYKPFDTREAARAFPDNFG